MCKVLVTAGFTGSWCWSGKLSQKVVPMNVGHVWEQVWECDRSQTAAAGDTEEIMAPALARTAQGWAGSILHVEATGTGRCRLLGGF